MEELKVNRSDFIIEKPGKVSEAYKIGKKIRGFVHGSVRKVVHRLTNEKRLIKTIHKSTLNSPEEEQLFFNEVGILQKLDHPHIISLHEFFQDEKNYYIVTEYCSGTELFDKFLDSISSEALCTRYMKQILSILVYLHEKKIVHRDLKPEDFIFSSKDPSAILKIVYFGTARHIASGEMISTKVGTPYYMAPEILQSCYNEKCDIWSAGVILYIMICGYPPFPGNSNEEILRKVETARFSFPSPEWDSIGFAAKDLITRMLNIDPELRVSAREALEHPWFSVCENSPLLAMNVSGYLNNLKNFRADRKLQKAVFTYISTQLACKQETQKLFRLFKTLDTDSSGTLSRQELVDGFSTLYSDGIQDIHAEVDRIMMHVDIDQSGEIDYSEFVTATLNKKQLLSEEILESAFKVFDIDNSGKIDKQEIKSVLGRNCTYDEQFWQGIINEVDLNGDGEIDLFEFKEMMAKLIS